jgi:hypothetical protein
MDRVKEWWWSIRATHPISRIPWSAIRRIGQSRLLGLTIVVPFLGSLMLFNQSVVDVLTLSPELVRRWLQLSASETADAARKLTLSRLYYVYFGLSFLGIGSALFVLFCPLEIKNYSTPIEYQTIEGPHASKPRMTLILPFVALQYSRWMGDEVPYAPMGVIREMGLPDDFQVLFSAVVREMYLKVLSDTVDEIRENLAGDPDNGHPYEDFRNRPDPSKIADVIHSGRRIQMGFVDSLEEEAAEQFRNDVLMLHYMALDHTKPYFRLVIAAFYGLGFGLLLIPTAQTFFVLASNFVIRI